MISDQSVAPAVSVSNLGWEMGVRDNDGGVSLWIGDVL